MPAQNLPGLVLDRAHPLTRGLVGWWPMNEGGGRRAADVVNGNAGTHLLDPAWVGGGQRITGNAVKLNGTTQYIRIPHSPALAITSDITVSVWTRVTTITGYLQLLNKGPNPTSYPAPFQMVQVGGTGQMIWGRGNGSAPGGTDAVVSTSAAIAGEWVHWVGTWTGGVFYVYYNGRLDNTATASPTCTDAGLPLYVGTRADGAASLWNGSVAQVRLYNRAISGREVAQLYAEPLAGALAPVRTRLYVAPAVSPPATPTRPMSADRLYNRSLARIFRRGETA